MTACPSDDVLGALVQHALVDDEARAVTSHLDDCTACRELVIAAVRGGMGTPVTVALGTPSMPVERERPSLAGTTIGRYELLKLLGAGGMGQVYEARDHELERTIAVKVLRSELAGAPSVTERLVRESRLMAKVVHPNVITVYDVGREGDIVFIAMELVRGETLASFVMRNRPSWREIVELFEHAGEGLAAAHSAGIVHRDFKPDNVLVEISGAPDAGAPADGGGDRAKRLVVTDFGIARTPDLADDASEGTPHADIRLTAPGATIGTPAYMAPEQLDAKPVDARADVFAFAVSLWEALFGERPFRGATVAEIRAAMRVPPVATSSVPRRLITALERGLAIDPAKRTADMPTLLHELRKIRTRRGRVGRSFAAAGLVGIGIAGALVLTRSAPKSDACERGLDRLARAYNAPRMFALRGSLGGAPKIRDAAVAKLDGVAAAWRATQLATCHADATPIQTPEISTCLEARLQELDGYTADVLLDGPAHASQLSGIVGDPARCAKPTAGLLTARVPADPALRRKVTELRYHAFDLEAARDRADYATAIALGTKYLDASNIWPVARAELLYALGTTQSMGGDNKQSLKTLREAAQLGEAQHADYITTNAWIQLALGTGQDEGDSARGLEYVGFAEAALDRMGRPQDLEVMVDYVKGVLLSDVGKLDEAEVVLQRAVELAETSAPEFIPQTIQGLGYLYEDRGRFADAVAAYRKAIDHLPQTTTALAASMIVFRERLAVNLSHLGKTEEALDNARQALALAQKTTSVNNMDIPTARVQLVQVLQDSGQLDEAKTQSELALAEIAKAVGERNERYGEVLMLKATMLGDEQRWAESLHVLERACEIVAFTTEDGSPQHAECLLYETNPLQGLKRFREALAIIDRIEPIFAKAGDTSPQYAEVIVERGSLQRELGHLTEAQADLERAIQLFAKASLEPGHTAAAEAELAKLLWTRDPPRAHQLIDDALAKFEHAIPSWKRVRGEAIEWRDTDGKPRVQHLATPPRGLSEGRVM